MKSDVYLVKVSSSDPNQRQAALKRIIQAKDFCANFKKEEIVPVKLTIGDTPCVYNVSPELVKIIIQEISRHQAKPFLFDTCVIYQGERQNAVDHLTLAEKKGFSYAKIGVPFIIADGLFGQDGREFVVDREDLKKIRVPSFVGMLDSLVVLTHVTGHIVSGYAGAIKNVAMGMSCRATKQMQHSSLKPSVLIEKCTKCGCCMAICPAKAITFKNEKKAFIDQSLCVGCAECLCACKFDAIKINWEEEPKIFCERMVAVAGAILNRFKNKFFINFALDITKECDCISKKGEKIVSEDFGILASNDIVSLDQASMDLALEHKKTNFLAGVKELHQDTIDYAVQRGMGNKEYNLIEL
ncbi:MAG: DUF362 domain-containing protein [Candidatus Omnitrophica bacterium]|nr:DUF362 domain-containing protein [Candidatus Omnitrophota bacterium]